VKIDPRRADAWFDRGSFLIRLGFKQKSLGLIYEGLRSYECALTVEPGHELAAQGRAEVVETLGPERVRNRPTPPAKAPRCNGREAP
jgi:hypothetical protein